MNAHQMPQADDSDTLSTAGDASTWLDEHGDVLYRYARSRVGQRELAEDLVQDTLLAALQSRDRFQGRATVRTWLLSILRHKIVDHCRRMATSISPAEADPIASPDPVRAIFQREGFVEEGPRVMEGAGPGTRESRILGRARRLFESTATFVVLGVHLAGDRRGGHGRDAANPRLERSQLACAAAPRPAAAPRMPGKTLVHRHPPRVKENLVSWLNSLLRVLTLHCEAASELSSRELDDSLPRLDRAALLCHVLACRSCLRFRAGPLDSQSSPPPRQLLAETDSTNGRLSAEARCRIALECRRSSGSSGDTIPNS